MSAEPLISSPFTEHWLAWLMLMALLMMIMVHVFQPGVYVRVFRSLPTTKERDSIFVGSGSDIRSSIVFALYMIILLAVMLLWRGGVVHSEGNDYGIISFLRCAGCAAAALTVRALMQMTLQAVFFRKGQLETYARHYRYLNIAVMVLMYPIMLLALFTDINHIVITILLGLLATAYAVGLIYKTITLVPLSHFCLLTLPLYWLTAETLPLLAMMWLAIYWN